MTEWNWNWDLWPGSLASKRLLRLREAPAVTAAPRRPRVDVPGVPGGDSMYLRLKNLWNDPGTGRFVKRGRSTAKAQAMMFVPGDAVREVARAKGRVRARVADNRMSRSGIRRGDVIEVGFKDDEFGVVEVLSSSGKKRKYQVQWARFDQVEADTPDVPEVELLEPKIDWEGHTRTKSVLWHDPNRDKAVATPDVDPSMWSREKSRWGHGGTFFRPFDDSDVWAATPYGRPPAKYRPVKADGEPFRLFEVKDLTHNGGTIVSGQSDDEEWNEFVRYVATKYGIPPAISGNGKPYWPISFSENQELRGFLRDELEARGFDGWWTGGEVVVWNYDKINGWADTDPNKPMVSSGNVVAKGWPVGKPYPLQPDMRQPLSRVSLDGRDVQMQSLGGDSIDGTYISKWVMTDVESGDVMGWLDYTDSDDEFHIDYIEVDDKYRGQGVGAALLAFGMANASQNTIGSDRSKFNIDPGMLTSAGAAWLEQVNPEIREWRSGTDNVIEADTLDVVDSVRAQEADILRIALDNGGGDFPDCLEASEEINKRFGLPVEQGFFYGSQPGEAYNKMNWAPHAWVRLPDGSILDLTSNQFSGGAGPGTQVIRPGDPSYGRYWTEGKGMWETRSPEDALGWLQAGGVDVVEAPPMVRGTASQEWFDKTIGSEPWYHVTGFDRAAAILANGLDPSYGGLQSDVTAPPRPGAVYLAHKTMVDAGLAGNPLAELLDIDRPVTLEFDTSKLAYYRVVPDEDYFTIAEWEKPEAYGLPAWDPTVETSGAWAQRVGLGEQPGIVEKVVGQDNRFAYGGPVPAAAVKRVRFDAYFDEDETLVPASDWLTPEEALAVLSGGGDRPVLVSSRMAEAPVKVNDGMPSVTNIEPVSRDELNDDEVLKQSWRQPFAEDNRRLSREQGEARMAGFRRAPIVVSADAIEYRSGQGIPMDQGADATFARPGYSFPQLSKDSPVNPRGFGYVLGSSALADVAVRASVDLPPEIGLTDPNPSDDLLIQMGWHDGSTEAFYRGKMPPGDVRGIVLLTGPAPIAAYGEEPRWRLQDSSYPAYEGDGRYDTAWPPIDYEGLPGDTVFLSAVQATDNPEQTRREMAIAAAAGKDMKVLRNNGDIVDVEQVLAEYETAKVTTPDDWTGPIPLKPEGNEGNRHAEFVRRIFDDAGLARPGRAPYTFSRNHDWYAGGRAHAEDADKFVTEMRDVRDGAEDRMVIRVPLEVIPLLIADGRLKNQHESKQSEGTLDPRQRKDAERLLFGIPTRGGKVKDRPIYGLVETDGYRDGAQYGKFVISLKPETARRSTMTFGDSLGVANATYGYNTEDGVRKSKKKDEPDLRSAHGAAIPMTGDVSDEQILGATQANGSNRAYIEIQVHGGVSLDDMRSVRYSPWIQNDDSTRADLLEYAKNPLPGLPLELPQDVYDVAGPEVLDALTGAGVTVVAVPATGGAL